MTIQQLIERIENNTTDLNLEEVAVLTALLRELVAAREEIAASRKKLISMSGGFMVGGSLEDTLNLHNSRISTFAARLASDRAMENKA